jgi:anti-sigma-K factor RskA
MIDELDDLEVLAAEYALGVLDLAERQRAEMLMARDAEFARQVEAWNQRLAPLAEAVPPEPVPPEIWARIQSALRAREAVRRGERADAVADAVVVPLRRPRRTESLSFWRWCAAGASTVAATLALYIAFWPAPIGPAPENRFVAVLNRAVLNQGASEPAWVVTVDIAKRELTIRPVAEVAPGDQALELWLVAGGDAPPRSLGLLNANASSSLELPAAWTNADAAPAVLAISLEPAGGSPTGLPTGPVVFQGSILPLR